MRSIESPISAWIVVMLSGALEIVFSIAMKLSEGYTRLRPSVVSVVAAVLSVGLMSMTLKVLPVGTAYAVWAGIGTAGTAIFGLLVFNEAATPARLLCLAMILGGIVGLQLQGVA